VVGTWRQSFRDCLLTRTRQNAILGLNARIALKNKEELAHPTRFERVTFAFGGQRFYAANRGKTFSTNRKNRVVRAPGFEPTRLHLGAMDRARTAAFSRLFKLPPTGLGCPPIRKQGSCDSGYRDVADPRYQPPSHASFICLPRGHRGNVSSDVLGFSA